MYDRNFEKFEKCNNPAPVPTPPRHDPPTPPLSSFGLGVSGFPGYSRGLSGLGAPPKPRLAPNQGTERPLVGLLPHSTGRFQNS
eukprot:229123-Prorocentrum_minimum.AAC.1